MSTLDPPEIGSPKISIDEKNSNMIKGDVWKIDILAMNVILLCIITYFN